MNQTNRSGRGEVVPAGETLDRLACAPEDDLGSVRDLADSSDGHLDALGQRAQDGLRGGDQELVVLTSGRRQYPGVAPEGFRELSRVVRNGQQFQVHSASDPAPLADVAHVRGEAVREVYHGAYSQPGGDEPCLHPWFRPQVPADESFRAGHSVLQSEKPRRRSAELPGEGQQVAGSRPGAQDRRRGELPEYGHVHRQGVGAGRVAPERVDAKNLAGFEDPVKAAEHRLRTLGSSRSQYEPWRPSHRRHVRDVDRDGFVARVLRRGPVLEVVAGDEHVGRGHPVAPAQPQDGAIVPHRDQYLGRRLGESVRDTAYDLELVQRLLSMTPRIALNGRSASSAVGSACWPRASSPDRRRGSPACGRLDRGNRATLPRSGSPARPRPRPPSDACSPRRTGRARRRGPGAYTPVKALLESPGPRSRRSNPPPLRGRRPYPTGRWLASPRSPCRIGGTFPARAP